MATKPMDTSPVASDTLSVTSRKPTGRMALARICSGGVREWRAVSTKLIKTSNRPMATSIEPWSRAMLGAIKWTKIISRPVIQPNSGPGQPLHRALPPIATV